MLRETSPIPIHHILSLKCEHCQGSDIIRYGFSRKGVQQFYCKPCRRKFTADNAMPGRRFSPEQVGAAVAMFYSGLSVEQIRRRFDHIFDSLPSSATIYEWVVDYTRLAKHETSKFRPRLGDKWVADETVLKVGGKNLWLWNVMDARTRFLLATRLSTTRTTRDAEILFRKALKVAGRPPKAIVSDRLASYIDGIEKVFGAHTRHIQSQGMRSSINNNLSERLQGTIKSRSKVMRGLKGLETAKLVMDGWRIHYNFFRPHMSLESRTPAEAAGIDYTFRSWEDIAKLDVRPFAEERLEEERLRDKTFKPRVLRAVPVRGTSFRARPLRSNLFRTRRSGF